MWGGNASRPLIDDFPPLLAFFFVVAVNLIVLPSLYVLCPEVSEKTSEARLRNERHSDQLTLVQPLFATSSIKFVPLGT